MPGQGLGCQLDRLGSGEDRKRHEAAHVSFTVSFGFRDICQGLAAASHEIVEPPMGTSHGLDQCRIWPERHAVVGTTEDETHLHASALHACWNEVAKQRLLTSKLGEVQADGDLVGA